MGTYRSAIITAAGQNLVAESLTGGKAITFSNAKTSSYAYPEGTNLAELTDLQDIVQAEQPSMAQVINDNVVQVTARFSNENVESAYMIQTLGLYAKINDGDEVLFSVIQAITPDQMPAQNPVSPTAYIFNMQTAIQQASQVTVTVDPAGSATVQDIINLQQSKSYIQVITTNIPVSSRADNAWYLYDTDTQTADLTRHNVEMQDRNGHAYYPHTSSEVVFRPDGTTVEDALADIGEVGGKFNLQTYTSLAQLSLEAPVTMVQLYNALPGNSYLILNVDNTSTITDPPNGSNSGLLEIIKSERNLARFTQSLSTAGNAKGTYYGTFSWADEAVFNGWKLLLDETMIANNDTTTQAGFVADARIVKTHGDEIDQLNSEFQDWFGITEDGQRGWKEQGADTVNPFKGSHLEVLLQNTDSATSETHYFPPGNYKLSFLSMCRTNIAYCPICRVYKDESIIYTADTQLYTWSGSGQEVGVRGGIYDISLPDGGNVYLELFLSGVRVVPYAVAALYKV